MILPLLRTKHRADEPLDTLESLQVVWLMDRQHEPQRSIGDFSAPTTDRLRRVGLVEVGPIEKSIDKKHDGGSRRPCRVSSSIAPGINHAFIVP
jgi:hypothetical protein